MRLPDFLVIGAMKAGTSSLHRYLEQHPLIFATRKKELNFFNSGYQKGLDWYAEHFAEAHGPSVAGEASPNYSKEHKWPGTARRVAEALPQAKLIYVLRDPVDRMLSHYLHNVHNGREKRRFSDVIIEDKNLGLTSQYAWQIDHYLQNFDRDRIAIVSTDTLRDEPQKTLTGLFEFLGVDGDVEVDTSRKLNTTSAKLRSTKVSVPDDPALTKTDDGYALTLAMREQLGAALAPDIRRLNALWPDAPTWGLA